MWDLGHCGSLASVTTTELRSAAHPTQTWPAKQLTQLGEAFCQRKSSKELGHALKGPVAAGTWSQKRTSPPLSPRLAGGSWSAFSTVPRIPQQQLGVDALQHSRLATAAVQGPPQRSPVQPARLCCLPARSGCCRAAPLQLRRGSDAEGASKMPLGAGSAASQGRQRRGLSAMTVYSGKGAAWGQRQRSVAPPCPPPRRVRRTESSIATATGPCEQGLPDTAMARNRASSSRSSSTGCRQADSPARAPWGQAGNATGSSEMCPRLIHVEGDKQGCTEGASPCPQGQHSPLPSGLVSNTFQQSCSHMARA